MTNIGDASATFTVAVADTSADGAAFSTTGGSFTLAPGASRSVTISVDTTKGAADGFKQAQLEISAGGDEVAHAMLFVLVGEGEAAPGRHMIPPPFA